MDVTRLTLVITSQYIQILNHGVDPTCYPVCQLELDFLKSQKS